VRDRNVIASSETHGAAMAMKVAYRGSEKKMVKFES